MADERSAVSGKRIEAEGDKPKVAPTQRYFTELRASLKNAQAVERDLRVEVARLERVRDAAARYMKTGSFTAEMDLRDALKAVNAQAKHGEPGHVCQGADCGAPLGEARGEVGPRGFADRSES